MTGGTEAREAGAGSTAIAPVTLVIAKDDNPSVLANAVRTVLDDLVGDVDRAMALEEIGGDDLAVAAVVEACQTPAFLADRRIVLVRDAGRWSSEQVAPLIDYLADPLPTTALVLVGGGGRISQKLVNAVAKHGRVIDATVPTGKARSGWLVEQVRHGPVHLDAAAAELVAAHLGEDVGRLAGLLDTLASAYGEGAKIGPMQVEPFLGTAGGAAPWDLTDAIDRGDTAAALVFLHRLLSAGERHALAVLAVLHRHYAAMLRLDGSGISSEAEAAAATGMAPFPAGKALRQSQRLGTAGVARAIVLLAQADLDLRGMKDWPDGLVMEVLVARLSRLTGRAPAGRPRR